MEYSKGQVKELGQYIFFAAEIIIAFLAPGLLFLQASAYFSKSYNPIELIPIQGFFANFSVITVSIIIGAILSLIGNMLLTKINQSRDFTTKIEDGFYESLGISHSSAFDFPAYLRTLSPEEFQELRKSADQDSEYWSKLFKSQCDAAKSELRRKVALGETLIPFAIIKSISGTGKDLRTYLSDFDSMHGFCRAILAIIPIFGIWGLFIANEWTNKLFILSATLIGFVLWLQITIHSYGMYRIKQLALFLGLESYISNKESHPTT